MRDGEAVHIGRGERNVPRLGKAMVAMAGRKSHDSVRDLPDVSLFAANGVWGHYYAFCWSANITVALPVRARRIIGREREVRRFPRRSWLAFRPW